MDIQIRKAQFMAQYKRLNDAIDALNALWPSVQTGGYGWVMGSLTGSQREPITPIAGNAFIAKACALFKEFELLPTQDPDSTTRLPGWIAIPKNQTAVFRAIDAVNVERKTLLDLFDEVDLEMGWLTRDAGGRVKRIHPKARRTHFVKLLDGLQLSFKQLSRTIRYMEEPVRKVGFSWVKQNRVTSLVKREDAMAWAEQQIILTNDPIRQEHLQARLDMLARSGSDTVKTVRNGPPHPKLFLYGETVKRRYRLDANGEPIISEQAPVTYDAMIKGYLPVFVAVGDKMPDIKDLIPENKGQPLRKLRRDSAKSG